MVYKKNYLNLSASKLCLQFSVAYHFFVIIGEIYSQFQLQKRTAITHKATKFRNALQKLTTQLNIEAHCKYLQHN